MTPDELLKLETEATPGKWHTDARHYQHQIPECDLRLIVAMRNNIVALCEIAKAAGDLITTKSTFHPSALIYYIYAFETMEKALSKLNGE